MAFVFSLTMYILLLFICLMLLIVNMDVWYVFQPIEKDSPLLTDQYLQTIEDTYKTKVLPRFK